MSQNRKLLEAMANGARVTRLNALFDYRVQNITARITDLRNKNIDVMTEIKVDSQGAPYAEYFLNRWEIDRLARVGALRRSQDFGKMYEVVRV